MSSSNLRQRKIEEIPEIKQSESSTEFSLKSQIPIENEDSINISGLDIVRMLGGILLLNLVISWWFTDSIFYGYQYNKKFTNINYWQHQVYGTSLNLTESELTNFNGTDPSLPIYIAVNGAIWDVSGNREIYKPSGSYGFFAGKDIARALATNCLNHLNHDIRDIQPGERRRLKGWIEYFDDKYWRVGVVNHQGLDGIPMSRDNCQGKY
ncbi:hypothetical protein WICMUC_004701 [Wickerhamomyces mucosus]|uniref:Cytochrome b5 heme-binding domain-containing protein n=1 Tax=Wickerhamomyces mucosus TaxID=1378264 RepID=A0A9P8TAA7_9ASCO|nr:hypothetical protein WICMUC_004701 [Wickerhamomyces mucosus]